MLDLTIILQTNYENWGVQSMLIAAIAALGGVIGYLYVSKEKALAEKDKQLLALIREHKEDVKLVTRDHESDMKEWVSDVKVFIGNYHTFMKQITDIANGSKRQL